MKSGSFSGGMVMEVEQTESSMALMSAEDREEKMAAAVADASKRYEAWEAEFVSVGQKESELFSAQWKLIREEMGLFSRDLAAVKFGLDEMRMSSRSAMARMRMSFAEKEESGKKEEEQRQQLEDGLREEIRQQLEDGLR